MNIKYPYEIHSMHSIRVNVGGDLNGTSGFKRTHKNLEYIYKLISGELATTYKYRLFTLTQDYRWDDTDPETRQKIKRTMLPSAEFNSYCSGPRRIENVHSMTGLIVVDVDGLESEKQAETLRDTLFDDPVLGCVLSFVSISGKGVKAVLHIGRDNVTVDNIKEWYAAAAWYIWSTYNVKIDMNACDAVRLCFLAYDPHARLNRKWTVSSLDPKWGEAWNEYREKRAAARKTTGKNVVYVSKTDRAALEQLLIGFAEFCTAHGMCFLDDYNAWIGFGANCHRVFNGSSEGMEVWDACSRNSRKYSRKALVEKWGSLPVGDGTITVVGMLYNFAKSYCGTPNLHTWLVGELDSLGMFKTSVEYK